ncbi:hypothetical protein [[Acholeplasma] multilocale]|uniref:hypothetical protein n=1 Tax=[Acholeplasma] multilocale TaxID=264638 RepID=UPI00047A0C52|nr:hypothetical protein [[Acholeplasma] multilocale]
MEKLIGLVSADALILLVGLTRIYTSDDTPKTNQLFEKVLGKKEKKYWKTIQVMPHQKIRYFLFFWKGL